MNVTKISDAQREEIKHLWNVTDEALDIHLDATSVFSGRYSDIEEEVRREMQREGKGIPRGAAGLFGIEFAKRLRRKHVAEFERLVARYAKEIEEAVCVKFAYCDKRRKGDFETEGWTVATGVADALLTHATGFPLPVTTVSVYLVKRRVLDLWCECDKKRP